MPESQLLAAASGGRGTVRVGLSGAAVFEPGLSPKEFSVAVRELRGQVGLSQNGFALLVREAGAVIGWPNRCSKRLVQKWEQPDGHGGCRVVYRMALDEIGAYPANALSLLTHPVFNPEYGPSVRAAVARLDRIAAEVAQLRRALVQSVDSGGLTRRE